MVQFHMSANMGNPFTLIEYLRWLNNKTYKEIYVQVLTKSEDINLLKVNTKIPAVRGLRGFILYFLFSRMQH